jgi:hypothetical protein
LPDSVFPGADQVLADTYGGVQDVEVPPVSGFLSDNDVRVFGAAWAHIDRGW